MLRDVCFAVGDLDNIRLQQQQQQQQQKRQLLYNGHLVKRQLNPQQTFFGQLQRQRQLYLQQGYLLKRRLTPQQQQQQQRQHVAQQSNYIYNNQQQLKQQLDIDRLTTKNQGPLTLQQQQQVAHQNNYIYNKQQQQQLNLYTPTAQQSTYNLLYNNDIFALRPTTKYMINGRITDRQNKGVASAEAHPQFHWDRYRLPYTQTSMGMVGNHLSSEKSLDSERYKENTYNPLIAYQKYRYMPQQPNAEGFYKNKRLPTRSIIPSPPKSPGGQIENNREELGAKKEFKGIRSMLRKSESDTSMFEDYITEEKGEILKPELTLTDYEYFVSPTQMSDRKSNNANEDGMFAAEGEGRNTGESNEDDDVINTATELKKAAIQRGDANDSNKNVITNKDLQLVQRRQQLLQKLEHDTTVEQYSRPPANPIDYLTDVFKALDGGNSVTTTDNSTDGRESDLISLDKDSKTLAEAFAELESVSTSKTPSKPREKRTPIVNVDAVPFRYELYSVPDRTLIPKMRYITKPASMPFHSYQFGDYTINREPIRTLIPKTRFITYPELQHMQQYQASDYATKLATKSLGLYQFGENANHEPTRTLIPKTRYSTKPTPQPMQLYPVGDYTKQLVTKQMLLYPAGDYTTKLVPRPLQSYQVGSNHGSEQGRTIKPKTRYTTKPAAQPLQLYPVGDYAELSAQSQKYIQNERTYLPKPKPYKAKSYTSKVRLKNVTTELDRKTTKKPKEKMSNEDIQSLFKTFEKALGSVTAVDNNQKEEFSRKLLFKDRLFQDVIRRAMRKYAHVDVGSSQNVKENAKKSKIYRLFDEHPTGKYFDISSLSYGLDNGNSVNT